MRKTAFLRVLESDDKPSFLKSLARGDGYSEVTHRIDVDCREFEAFPNAPFAYWASEDVRAIFRGSRSLGEIGVDAKQGLATADDFRFVRLAWEVPSDASSWVPFAKGGRLSSFYADIPEVVLWRSGAEQIRSNLNAAGSIRSNIWMLSVTERDFFLRPGLTWPVRASRFSPRVLPAGCIFSHRGYSAFSASGDHLWLWGVFNSSIFDYLFKICLGRSGFPEFLVGLLPRLPICPLPDDTTRSQLIGLAQRGWRLRRTVDTSREVSHAFLAPALLQVDGGVLGQRVDAWRRHLDSVESELEAVQLEIDELCFDLYGVSENDRRAVADGFGSMGADDAPSEDEDSVEDVVDETAAESDRVGLVAGLVSWAVGAAVGRFDVRLATGEREWPAEPDPFDPLPVCSPAMLSGGDGLPFQPPIAGYPLVVSPVLVEDPGHELDLASRVRAVFDVVFGEDADRWWTEVGAVLDPRTGEVETWLRRAFFDHHLKTYSKSRRKAPVLWPLGTRSGSYRVWLHAHHMTADTVFRVLNDIVGPKLQVEERRLSDLRQEAGVSPSASQRKMIDAQETFVAELRDFQDELTSVASLWSPDLNDGVVVVLAPLWRLFAHHRAWSSELKDRWKKLAAGDYDWAQLTMRLWPERVIPKCAEDRSLAIAHGLEDVFWVADKDNPDKWHPRQVPTAPISDLIAARTNPTITTARQHPTP